MERHGTLIPCFLDLIIRAQKMIACSRLDLVHHLNANMLCLKAYQLDNIFISKTTPSSPIHIIHPQASSRISMSTARASDCLALCDLEQKCNLLLGYFLSLFLFQKYSLKIFSQLRQCGSKLSCHSDVVWGFWGYRCVLQLCLRRNP